MLWENSKVTRYPIMISLLSSPYQKAGSLKARILKMILEANYELIPLDCSPTDLNYMDDIDMFLDFIGKRDHLDNHGRVFISVTILKQFLKEITEQEHKYDRSNKTDSCRTTRSYDKRRKPNGSW